EVLEDRTVLSVGPAPPAIDLPGLGVNPGGYAADHILVEYRPGEAPQALAGTSLGGAVGPLPGLYRVRLSAGTSAAAALAEYRGDARVAAAEPDYYLGGSALPNDPRLAEQWDVRNTGQQGGAPGADARVSQAWGATTG